MSKLLGALMCAVLATAALAVGPARAAAYELKIPVLIYHHVTCDRPSGVPNTQIWICPARFESQLSHLQSLGWKAITTDQLADALKDRTCPGQRRFVVTVDDSSAFGYTNAAPILERLGMRATFFVVVGLAGKAQALSFGQMRDLVSRGHAIGNHTMAHVDLVGRSQKSLFHQVEYAQRVLDSELGFRPRTFAYPNGTHDRNARRRARDSGFELAFTAGPGFTVSSARRMRAPRLFVSKHHTPTQLANKIEPYANPCP
ncbi:MAG: polysaccharide deacetylase family protein [Chloroflexota bacterium]|nr:polysaccharide deacetylase family protein [Chloroflexota bacterium]